MVLENECSTSYHNSSLPKDTNKAPRSYPIRCHYCSKFGHHVSRCIIKRNPSKWIWVIKGSTSSSSSTNTNGPKKNWVPRTKFWSCVVGELQGGGEEWIEMLAWWLINCTSLVYKYLYSSLLKQYYGTFYHCTDIFCLNTQYMTCCLYLFGMHCLYNDLVFVCCFIVDGLVIT